MYESFYGLKEKPFSMLPDPGFLYLSKKHQMALTLLEYGLLNQAGFCVVSGETGSGKTTLLRKLLENIEDNVTVGMITNTHKGFGGLLDWVLSAFNIHEQGMSVVDMHQRFIDFLVEQYSQNKTTLLIVDEAQNITAEKLEELRMLSNVNSEKDQVLQVILAGQPELKDTLQLPELRQFAQRIGVDHHLSALSDEETCGYINHRLSVAGANREIFTEEACYQIYEYSGGTPRLINLLCDTVMVYGFADQRESIDVDLVDEMVQERMRDSIVPLATRSPSKKRKVTKKKKDKVKTEEKPKQKTKPKLKKVELVKPAVEQQKPAADDIEESIPYSGEELEQEDTRTVLTSFGNKAGLNGGAAAEVIEFNEEVMAFDGSVKSPDEIEEDVLEPEKHIPVEESNAEVKDDGKGEEGVKRRGPNIIQVLEPEHEPEFRISPRKWIAASVVAFVLTAVILVIGTSDTDDSESVLPGASSSVPDVKEVPDNIKRQLEEAERMRQELARKQKEDKERMKVLEAASKRLQLERDEARATVAAEKKKREKEAELAKAAARSEKEAKEATEKAVAAALAAERKSNQLLELQAVEARRLEAELLRQREAQAIREQQAVEIESAAAVSANEVKKEESFKIDPCASSTARFLSTCR